jgi:hypothetical protein
MFKFLVGKLANLIVAPAGIGSKPASGLFVSASMRVKDVTAGPLGGGGGAGVDESVTVKFSVKAVPEVPLAPEPVKGVPTRTLDPTEGVQGL